MVTPLFCPGVDLVWFCFVFFTPGSSNSPQPQVPGLRPVPTFPTSFLFPQASALPPSSSSSSSFPTYYFVSNDASNAHTLQPGPKCRSSEVTRLHPNLKIPPFCHSWIGSTDTLTPERNPGFMCVCVIREWGGGGTLQEKPLCSIGGARAPSSGVLLESSWGCGCVGKASSLANVCLFKSAHKTINELFSIKSCGGNRNTDVRFGSRFVRVRMKAFWTKYIYIKKINLLRLVY